MQTLRTFILILFILLFASTHTLAKNIPINITAVILSKSQCKFNTKNATINFGQLDPGNPTDATGTAQFDYTCRGNAATATYALSVDDGLRAAGVGSPRMEHATTPAELMNYSLSLSHTSGSMPKNAVDTLFIDATILGSAYISAPPGVYNDTITVTILP